MSYAHIKSKPIEQNENAIGRGITLKNKEPEHISKPKENKERKEFKEFKENKEK